MKPYEWMSEAELQVAVAEYITRQYPDVMFHSDYGSGIKLTRGQAVRQKRQNGGRRAWPDMFIAEPMLTIEFADDAPDWRTRQMRLYGKFQKAEDPLEKHGGEYVNDYDSFYGLFLELKKDGTRLKKKNGEWATEHIAEQAAVLEELSERGYCAEFAVGFEEAKKIIDEYLGG